MPRELSVPEFDFAGGFYYPQLFEILLKHLRDEVPEITVEDEGEIAVQLMSAFALVGHLNNVNLDIAAHESLMVTSQLRDSLVAHLKTIDYEVAGDIPSTVQLLLTLSRSFAATTQIAPDNSLFSTKRESTLDPVVFESDAAVSVNRTDEITYVKVFDESAGTYTDYATEANTALSTFVGLPATPAVGDALYIGHDTTMTDRLRFEDLSVGMSDVFGLWEYSDTETEDEFPDSVVNLGTTLRLNVDSLLDTDGSINHAGLEVVVTLNSTGATETLTSLWDGSNNYVVTTGFLGQTTPSTSAKDYSVGTVWHRLPGLDDETNDGTTTLETAGDVDYTIPKDKTRDWQPQTVDSASAFWVRFRVVTVGGTPVAPTIDRIRWDKRNLYAQVDATQGQTRSGEVVGSSDGEPSQDFTLSSTPVIPGTIAVSVDGTAWTEVDDFLSSSSVDEHYTTSVDSDGLATVVFGDGTNGKIPPSGTNNITATYRFGAELDGNVGSESIIVNRTGLANVKRVSNPKPANGWIERRGASAADREKLKVEGPASLRVLGRGVSSSDIEFLTTQFKTAAGSQPFARAKVFEEGFGAKTVKIVVVGQAGAATSASDRQELEKYFNGDSATGEKGILVANQRVFARDYVGVTVDITATVTGGNKESIESAIEGLIGPVATDSNGDFQFDFGQDVKLNKIIATIFQADTDVEDVTLTLPGSDVVLDDDELPVLGTLTITVV